MNVLKYSLDKVSVDALSINGLVQTIHVEFDAEVTTDEMRAIFDMLTTGRIKRDEQ